MRLDKFLWCVRLYKTRPLAADACHDHVLVDQMPAKPAKTLTIGNVVSVKHNPIWRQFKILEFPPSRVGAKLVAKYIQEITPAEELAKLEEIQLAQVKRERGAGRPTKKDRRDLERFYESFSGADLASDSDADADADSDADSDADADADSN